MLDFDFLFTLSKGDCVVCDREYISIIQKKFLNKDNKIIDFKIMDYHDFKESFLGKIANECLIELVKVGYSIFHAKQLVDNYYMYRFLNIDDIRYEKASMIIDKYYQLDSILKNILLNNKIYFINPNRSDNLINLILKLDSQIIIKNIMSKNLTKAFVSECDNIEDEVDNLTNRIVYLYKNDPTKIYNIYIPSDEYLPYINRNFNLYNINYSTDNCDSLYDLDYVKDLISFLDKNNRFSSELINEYLLICDSNNGLDKLIEVINDFIRYDEDDYPYFRELFILKLKGTKINKKQTSSINVCSKLGNITEKESYFMLGFNQNVIIKSLSDDDFFDDNIKEKYNIFVTKDKNEYLKNDFLRKILSMNELYISYQIDNHLIPSIMLDQLKEEIEVESLDCDFFNNTSFKYAMYQTGKYLDEYEVYQKINKNLQKIYEENYLDEYQSYDNKFNGHFLVRNKLNLSYTQMDTYSSCKYQFYLKYILKIREYIDPKNTEVGNYFHKMLSDLVPMASDSLEIDKLTENYLNEKGITITNQKKYYYEKYQSYLIKVLKYIETFDERSQFNDSYYEKEFIKQVSNDSVVGRIDKMLVAKKDNKSKVVVIDYKTGNTIIDLPLIEYGLSLQIPFYFYLLSDIENTEIIGGYIQKVIPSKIYENNPKKDYEENYFDEYQYNGLTIDVEENLPIIDSNYLTEKSIIAGLKVKSDGSFYKNFIDKTLTSEEINKIKQIVDQNVRQALVNIHTGNFVINPKIIDNKTTCTYCKYYSICNHKYADYVHLKKDKELSFLRGGKNDSR